MVPEVSLFVAGGVSYNGSLGFRSTNSSGAMGPLPPPSPQKLNGSATSALHRPTPDFSAMFDNSGGGRNPFPHYTEPAVSSPAPQQLGVTRPAAAVPLTYPNYNPVGYTGNASGYASGEPLQHEQQQQSVNHTSASYPSQGDIAASSSGQQETSADHSPIHPDVIKLLNWQNEQLKLLQEQVQTLLNCSPGAGMKTSCSAVQTEFLDAAAVRNQSTNQTTTSTGRSMSTTSTNTSSVWPEIQRGMDRLHLAIQEEEEEEDHSAGLTLTEMRNSNIKVNSSDGDSLRSPAPPLNLDMPDFAESDCSPDIRRQDDKESWESPVLGESVSMYAEQEQQQEVHRVYNDILTKVNKLLAEPEQPQHYNQQQQKQSQQQQIPQQKQLLPQQNQQIPRQQHQIPQQHFQQQLPPSSDYQDTNHYSIIADNQGSSEGGNVDPTAATLARLRQLGVSFINPEDLQTSGERSTRAPEYSNLFLPRAASPSQSVWTNSTDTSLEISSLALKYLDESQLSKLAEKHRGEAGERSAPNMSLATTEFLQKHGLDQDTTRNPLRPLDNLTNTPTRAPTRQRNTLDLRRTSVERFREMKRSNEEVEVQRLSAGYEVSGEQVNEVYAGQRIQFVQAAPPSGGQATLRRPEELPASSRRRRNPTLPTNADAYDQRPRNIQTNPLPLPELTNRVLDITAIKNQPKLL